jgi:hypothetical protein
MMLKHYIFCGKAQEVAVVCLIFQETNIKRINSALKSIGVVDLQSIYVLRLSISTGKVRLAEISIPITKREASPNEL